MKDKERYLGANYSNICQPSILNEIPATFSDPEMPTIIPDTGVEHPKTDVDVYFLKKKIIDEAIHQKLRKKYVYEIYMHNIYNLIVGQTNDQL